MLKKVLIAAAIAAIVPAAAAQAHERLDRHGPAPIVITHKAPVKIDYRNHGPKIVYKTIFQTKKIVTVKKMRGRYVKVVKWVKVPVKVAFLNGRPIHRF